MAEKDFVYEAETEVADLNGQGFLKPYGYQKLIAFIAERHLKKYNLDVASTLKHNLSWVLVSLNIDIRQPVCGVQKLYGRTWYSGRTGIYYRREIEYRNEKGDIVFCGSTFSVIIDTVKRSLYLNSEIPFKITEPAKVYTMEAKPKHRSGILFHDGQQRTVYPSFIDPLGHVNNCRYGEFAYDALSEKETENLKNIYRTEIYFLSEMRVNDIFTVSRQAEENKLIIQGYNNSKNKISFYAVFYFSNI